MFAKEAGAKAFCKVLEKYGFKASVGTMVD
jgi:hypothetical protein